MRKVLSHIGTGPAVLGAHQLGGSSHVVLEKLAAEHAARQQRARRQLEDAPEDVQAVLSPIEREAGLVANDLLRERGHNG